MLQRSTLQKQNYFGIRLGSESDSSTDVWLKFDVYLPETLTGTDAGIYISNSGNELLRLEQYKTDSNVCTIRALGSGGVTLNESSGGITNLKTGAVNTIWMHVSGGSSGWNMSLVVNGEYIVEDFSTLSYESAIMSIFSFRISPEQPISNLIISDTEIDLKETIVEVGNSDVETTMVESDGTYSSAQAGDYVLQTLDTSDLYNLFGSDSKVSGMVAIAAPAYTTGEDVTQIKCRIVDGGTSTDYRIQDPKKYYEADAALTQYSEEEFAALENEVPAMAKQLDITSDTTFASLNGLKVGWVTA